MNTRSIALKARIRTEGKITLPLQGRCMDPLLVAGDEVKIIPVVHYVKGALCLFELPDGSLAVHRLIDKIDSEVIMKGDRSRRFETVPYQNILGVVSEVKLADCNSWITISQTRLTMEVISYLSRKMAKDKSLKKEHKFDLMIKKVRSKFLISFSYLIRRHWKSKCGAKING